MLTRYVPSRVEEEGGCMGGEKGWDDQPHPLFASCCGRCYLWVGKPRLGVGGWGGGRGWVGMGGVDMYGWTDWVWKGKGGGPVYGRMYFSHEVSHVEGKKVNR